jgi:hypothetical protein
VTKLIDDTIGLSPRAELIKIIYENIEAKNYKNAIDAIDNLLKTSPSYEELHLKLNESFYRSNLQSFLLGAGLKAIPELHNNLGRSDLVVESKGKQYVIELKVAPKSSQADTAAINAIKQIIGKGYDSPFRNPVLLGLCVSEEKRNIAGCVYVENNKAMRLEMTNRYADVLKDIETIRPASHSEETPKPRGPKP